MIDAVDVRTTTSNNTNTNTTTITTRILTADAAVASRCVHAGAPGSVLWVNHFARRHKHGFGLSDCSPKFAMMALDIFSNHYPECLQTMFVVDAPPMFDSVWSTIKSLLPPKTQKKASFVNSKRDNRAEFVANFGEELAEFLLCQIAKDAR